MMDSPKKLGYRMPAEYEPHHGTLMVWPTRPGSWPFQGKAAKKAFSFFINSLNNFLTFFIFILNHEGNLTYLFIIKAS